MAQATFEAADDADAKSQQALADGPGIHDVGGNDEQRHCQQYEAVVQAVTDLLGSDAQVLALEGQVDNRADDDGVRDRRADRGQPEQHDQTHGECKRHVVGAPSSCGSLSSFLRIWRRRSA